jgi:hypothetical protein
MKMKKLEFTIKQSALKNFTIHIFDEELFKRKCNQWFDENKTLDFWDLKDKFFNDCIIVIMGDYDYDGEVCEDFFELMSDNDFRVSLK